MTRPDRTAFESMARIGYSEKAFVDYIASVLAETKDNLVCQQDSTQMRILQGRAQAYSDLLDLIKKAPEIVRKA